MRTEAAQPKSLLCDTDAHTWRPPKPYQHHRTMARCAHRHYGHAHIDPPPQSPINRSRLVTSRQQKLVRKRTLLSAETPVADRFRAPNRIWRGVAEKLRGVELLRLIRFMSGLGPGCVKSRTSQGRAELFSQLSTLDRRSECNCFRYRRN